MAPPLVRQVLNLIAWFLLMLADGLKALRELREGRYESKSSEAAVDQAAAATDVDSQLASDNVSSTSSEHGDVPVADMMAEKMSGGSLVEKPAVVETQVKQRRGVTAPRVSK